MQRVEREAGCDAERYAAILAAHPEATFFHTRTWARIVTTGFPQLEDCSAIFRIDGRPYALPLFCWKRIGGLVTTAHSSFPFLYGGPIPAEPEAWGVLLDVLSRRPGSLIVLGNPFAPQPPPDQEAPVESPPPTPSPLAVDTEITHLLRLPDSVDEYWSETLTSQKRNDIRRLTKKGVTVDLSTDDADVVQVYRLYQQRMATWGKRPGLVYPLAFYRAMLAHGGGAVRLYVARFEDQLIGGTFVCRWNRIAHYNAGYFDHERRSLRPNVLIQERIIRDAIEDGFRIYDMLPSAGLKSVEAFKESFGGVRTPFPRWKKLSGLHRLVFGLRGALERRRAGAPPEQGEK
jgi:hypothetical protein